MRTTYKSDRVLNTYRGTNDTAPAAVYAGLITAITTAEAGTVTEASFAGYARVAITFGAPAGALGGRQIANTAAVLFAAKTDAGAATIVAVGIWDALTVGNLMDVIPLTSIDPFAFVSDDIATDLLKAPAHGVTTNQKVRLESFVGSVTLPTGLAENTEYFVIASGLTVDVFKLSATQGGSAIDLTVVGKGLVLPQTDLVINQNDQANFAIGVLKLADD